MAMPKDTSAEKNCRLNPLGIITALLILLPWSLAWGSDTSWLVDASTIGIPVGGNAPTFELPDQTHRMRKLSSLMGPRGLILVFIRSADW
jgi:hypothetical protein